MSYLWAFGVRAKFTLDEKWVKAMYVLYMIYMCLCFAIWIYVNSLVDYEYKHFLFGMALFISVLAYSVIVYRDRKN